MVELARDLGFSLLGGVFAWAGVEHFLNFRAVAFHLAGRGFRAPALLLAAGSTLECVAGLCLVFGFARLCAAVALIAFTIAASLMVLDFWRQDGAERQAARSAFIINIAVIGGLILAATSDTP